METTKRTSGKGVAIFAWIVTLALIGGAALFIYTQLNSYQASAAQCANWVASQPYGTPTVSGQNGC